MKGYHINSLILLSLTLFAGCGGGGDSGPVFTLNKTQLNWNLSYYEEEAPAIVVTGSASGIDRTVYIVANASSANFINSMQVAITSNSSGAITINPKLPSDVGIGTHTGRISISLCYDENCQKHVSGSPKTLEAIYTIKPEIRLEKDNLDIFSTLGSQSLESNIIELRAESVSWIIEDIPNWLSISPSSGQGDTSLSVSINNEGVESGVLDTSVKVTSLADNNIFTALNVKNFVEPQIIYTNQPILAFSELSGDITNSQRLDIESNSDEPQPWVISSKSDWISIDTLAGLTGQSIDVSISSNNTLEDGQHVGEIVFYSEELQSEFTVQLGFYKNTQSNGDFFEYELPETVLIDYNPLRAEMLLVSDNKLQSINLYTYSVEKEYVLPDNFFPESMFISADAKHVYLTQVVGGLGDQFYRLSLDNGDFVSLSMGQDYNGSPQYGSSVFFKGKPLFIVRNRDSLHGVFDDFVIYGPDSIAEISRIPSVNEYSGPIKSSPGSNYFYSSSWQNDRPLTRYEFDFNWTANKVLPKGNAIYTGGDSVVSLSKSTNHIALPATSPTENALILESGHNGINYYKEVSSGLFYNLDAALFDENNDLLMINDSEHPYVQKRNQLGEQLATWNASFLGHRFIDAQVSFDNKYLIVRTQVSVLNGNATILSFFEL